MAVTIRFAATADDVDALLRARHHVLAELDRTVAATPDGRIVDRFDALPTTHNVIAEHHRLIVGGVRFTLGSNVGTPPEEQFDFGDGVTSGAGLYAAVSTLFLEPLYRGTCVARQMLAFGYAWAASVGCTRVIAVASTSDGAFLESEGYVVPERTRPRRPGSAPAVPVLLDLEASGWPASRARERFDHIAAITVELAP